MADLVSVIIPTYNRADLLRRAIDCVLAQTYQPIEIIVVDDGSTDATPSVMAEYAGRIVGCRQSNQGVSSARNQGLRLAQGEYIAFLDSDDLWARDKLDAQISALRRHAADVSYTWYIMVDEQGRFLRAFQPSLEGDIFAALYMNNFLVTPHIVARRRCFAPGSSNELLFDTELAYGEDWKLWLQLSLRWRFSCVPRFLVSITDHPQRVYKTGQVEKILGNYARIESYFWNDPIAATKLNALGRHAKAITPMRRGYIWFLKGDKRRALAEFGLALRIDPTFLHAYQSILQTLVGRSSVDVAVNSMANLQHPQLRKTGELFPELDH